jgi:hypothetical protein
VLKKKLNFLKIKLNKLKYKVVKLLKIFKLINLKKNIVFSFSVQKKENFQNSLKLLNFKTKKKKLINKTKRKKLLNYLKKITKKNFVILKKKINHHN